MGKQRDIGADNVINFNNFISSVSHKTDELQREISRFQAWSQSSDEIESQALFLERESRRLLERAQGMRDLLKANKEPDKE